ncbi:MAG: prepilin-type N-terminal cleavage/methylation domain-containing protein [Sedimentisphaerales bacterium]|nr:prepilin-type N-terminal cleavage/methylation domain-containing protein [Sedimentisphaerales bacterium]
MKNCLGRFGHRRGLSLAEVLAALVIGSMVMIAVLGLYRRTERAAAAVHAKLNDSRLPGEILQRIAEDIDRLISSDSDTRITIENKYKEGYRTARLTMSRTITDNRGQRRTLEEIIWQGHYDIESDLAGLVIYRGHSGITSEDKLLDDQRAEWEKGYPMVPICSGVTHFEITVPSGEKALEKWTSETLPKGITVTLSFSLPVKTSTGEYEILDEHKITRTMAVDRTRKISFQLKAPEDSEGTGSGRM